MKKQLITLACLCVASLAFGQATNEDRPPGERTYTANAQHFSTGAVASYEPGQNITLNSTDMTHPMRYVVARNVRYNWQGGGRTVTPDLIKQGAKVKLSFNRHGQVSRITLIEER